MYVRVCDIGGMPTHTLSPIVSSFYLLPNFTYLSCVLSQRKNAIVLTTTTSFKSMLFNERQPQNVFFCPVFIVNINQFPINEIGTIETYMPRHQSQWPMIHPYFWDMSLGGLLVDAFWNSPTLDENILIMIVFSIPPILWRDISHDNYSGNSVCNISALLPYLQRWDREEYIIQ